MTSRIIHSGRLLLLRKASTTLRRLAYFWRFWIDCSTFIFSRSSTASVAMSTLRSRLLIASAPICAVNAVKPYSSRALRYWSSLSSSFCFMSVSPGSMTT